jgi:LPXTG-site transpeptidase (sortase) family protein
MTLSAKKFAHVALIGVLICEGLFAVGMFVHYHRGGWNTATVADPLFVRDVRFEIESGTPLRLRIPAIDVDAKIQSVGLDPNGSGEMGVPSNFTDAGWYNGGPRPGMGGSAVIAGHLSGKYLPKAVFHRLDELKPGDIVEVIDEFDTHIQFEVTEVKTYDHNDSADEVFKADTPRPRLNLITCAGDWIENAELFTKRTVVYTEMIGSSVE